MQEQPWNHKICAALSFCVFLICLVPFSAHGFQEKGQPKNALYSIIVQAAKRYNIEVELVRAIIMVESTYDARAVSGRGARGLMQLMPATAAALGVEDCFDPEQNIDAGVRYFQRLIKEFKGDITLALAAYHAGPGRVRKAGDIPEITSTRQYVTKVMEVYHSYKKKNEVPPLP